MNKHRVRTVVLSAVAAGSLLFAVSGAQAAELADVQKTGVEIHKMAQASQAKIDKLAEATNKLTSKYKSVLKEIDGLRVYNAQMERQISAQVSAMKDLEESIEKVTYVERQITPLMWRMIDALDRFIELDVPFEADIRKESVEELREMMDRAGVDASEKFRGILEIYQIESDYGRAVKASQATLEIDGKEREVDMLQLGRVALIYMTRDGEAVGAWNNKTREWERLPNSYKGQVALGLRIARKQAAADRLLQLPILAPEAAQ
ncbi:MAG: hypothetical protein CMF31_04245 [Kordiimonas sp.]|nr:hypothetical protein [Kordiimonas sp.]